MASLLFLAACSAEPDAPGAITADEQQQLNDAAAMLDANSVSAAALNESDVE
ncbi:hypothetical protein M0208_07140 [Sphingomonas sp. SUN019]|uniref:hypothetical protein n=1 Tax=Sphingomonas sp. SUN019 TaxID=2937788 RepID=UPI002164C2FE|nr:hypothetical protein [Sphingomonas sp. SUN019]UVO50305.1 hypothetical protein M0208_07140 [Sphingomonas sp. SUN019]